jgi:hypothetical protein
MIEEGKRGNSSPINENLSEFLGIEEIILGNETAQIFNNQNAIITAC